MKSFELIGVLASIDQVFDSGPDRRCVVGTIRLANRECATVKGYAREDELERGVTYRFYGHNKTHPKYGPQFNFNSFVEESPVDEDSVLAYLETCRHPDRGSVTHRVAVLLFERFGLKAIDKLIDDPVAAADGIKQWGPEKASIAASHLKSSRGTQRCKLDLIMLLNGRGFPKKTIDRCIKLWGASAANVVRENPFELVHLPGIGFRGADKMYCDLARQSSATDQEYQVKLGAINRQGLCLTYAVQCESRSSGSTWIPTPFALSRVTQQIGGTMADPQGALQWAILEGSLVEYRGHVAISRMATHELDIAAAVTAADDNHDWPSIDEIAAMAPDGKPLSDHQLDAIRLATSQRIGALQGSPGCLHGDTKIYDPTDGSNHTVRDRMKKGKEFSVIAIDSMNSLVIAKADCPKIYPKSEMLRFTFESGISVTVTRGHRFWTGDSFESAETIQRLFSSCEFRLPSISELDLSVHVQDALRSKKTTEDSPECCSAYFHQCDEQPQFQGASCQSLPPSQVDVHGRTFSFQDKSSRNHHHRASCLPSMPNYDQQTELHFDSCDPLHSRQEFSEPSSGLFLPESQPYESQVQKSTETEQPACASQLHPGQLSLYASSSCYKSNHLQGYTGVDGQSLKFIVSERIVNIESVGDDQYFDFHVPVHENYWAEGFFHHNTGKTFSVSCVVKALIGLYGKDCIAVAAPTGKAGVRVAQSMSANGVDLPASTIHRLLVVETEGRDGWSFHYHEQNPVPYRFIVLDESSMIDVDLLASLLRACTPSTHLLFVGDSNQLAPVGHGRPFFDLQSCIPTGHLTEIRRNSGRIVQSCAEIRDRNSITFSPKLDLPQENLPLIEVETSQAPDVCENLIARYRSSGLDVIEHMQFLTAKNDNSPVARKPLNKLLQQVLNPNGEQVHGNPFRLGDKIVCLKNASYPDPEEQHEQHFIANGELGRVTSLKPGRMVIKLSDPPRSILVTHAPVQDSERDVADSEDAQRGAVGDWDLGYALSVHRSQGSQWQYVVVLADPSGGMVQTREWLYTAISRAETATFVIGNRQVVNQMLRRNGIKTRKTFLVERVAELRPFVLCLETLWEGV